MSSYDIVDFMLENDRWKKIGPVNQIKTDILMHTRGYTDFSPKNMELVRKKFKNVGTCMVINLLVPEDFEQLSQYYLPWYWPDIYEQIRFNEYINQFTNRNINLIEYEKITNLVQSLRLGWDYIIEVIIAFDTIKNIGVIIDGTHRSLTLYCIRMEDDGLLERLLQCSAPVKHCRMISSQSRTIFREDFKL